MIKVTEILMGRHVEYPLDDALLNNLGRLVIALNRLRGAYGKPMQVTSGYRPGHYNKRAGGAEKSAHMTLEACDFADPTGKLDLWCLNNALRLKEWGLYLEHPESTPGWCHVQIRPPASGKTVFTLK